MGRAMGSSGGAPGGTGLPIIVPARDIGVLSIELIVGESVWCMPVFPVDDEEPSYSANKPNGGVKLLFRSSLTIVSGYIPSERASLGPEHPSQSTR